MQQQPTLPEDEMKRVQMKFGKDAAELDKIRPLIAQMHKESLFSDLPFDEEPLQRIIGFLEDKPERHGSVYAEVDGEPAAFCYFVLRPFLGSSNSIMTSVHTVYLRSDIRSTPIGGYIWHRIMLTIRAWSAPRQSRGVMINGMTGVAIQETDTFVRAHGATPLGGNYFIRI